MKPFPASLSVPVESNTVDGGSLWPSSTSNGGTSSHFFSSPNVTLGKGNSNFHSLGCWGRGPSWSVCWKLNSVACPWYTDRPLLNSTCDLPLKVIVMKPVDSLLMLSNVTTPEMV